MKWQVPLRKRKQDAAGEAKRPVIGDRSQMSLSVDEVRRVATLAHLSLTDEDEKQFAVKLSGILDYIDQLSELDTSDVQPTSHSLEINNVFREDETKNTFGKETWQDNAPAKDHGHYTVPRVVEG